MKRLFVKHPDTSVKNNIGSASLWTVKYCNFVVYTVACEISVKCNTHILERIKKQFRTHISDTKHRKQAMEQDRIRSVPPRVPRFH